MKHLFSRRQRIGLMVALLALVFTVVTAQGGGLANTPWPMYQHDPGHSGRSDFTGINTPALMWKRELSYQWGGSGSGMSIGPDGTVYTVTEGNLFALTYPDAQVKWMIDKAYSYSVPAVSASNLLYWGFDDTFAVISSTGQITGGLSGLTGAYGFGSSPVIAPDGTVYVAKGALWSWTASGEINWYHNFGGMVGEYTSPALGPDGTIYMTAFASGGELFAFDSDGNVKWSEYFSANSSPTVAADGTIYVSSANGTFHAFNPDGSSKWIFESDAYGRSGSGGANQGVIGTDGTIYFSAGYGPTYDGLQSNIYALNPNGSLKWKFPSVGTLQNVVLYPSVVDAGNHVIACGYNTPCYSFNPDGTVQWQYAPGDTVLTSPLLTEDGVLWIMTVRGVIHALTDSSTPIMRTSPSQVSSCGMGTTTHPITIAVDGRASVWTASVPENTPWLTLVTSTGSTSDTLKVQINSTGLAPGRHTAMLRLSVDEADVPNRVMSLPITVDTQCTIRLPLVQR